jgi:uncharacterized protein YggE
MLPGLRMSARALPRWSSLALLATLAGLDPAPAAAQTPPATPPSTVEVTGEAEVKAVPDRAVLELGVHTEAGTAREAMRSNAQAMDAVVTALRRLGLSERQMRTREIQLSPRTEEPPPRPMGRRPLGITGYRAGNTLEVTVEPLDKLGPVIDAAVGAGANVAGGVHFSVRDEEALRRQALADAVQAARAKAQVLAQAAQVRLGPVRQLVEEPSGPLPMGGMAMTAFAETRAAPLPPVQPGELTLRVRVRVSFALG